jgi:hypothetical protein
LSLLRINGGIFVNHFNAPAYHPAAEAFEMCRFEQGKRQQRAYFREPLAAVRVCFPRSFAA